jgi:class 3 adenylate cyclase
MVQIQEVVQAREHGEITVEGSARPVRIYEVLGPRLPLSVGEGGPA